MKFKSNQTTLLYVVILVLIVVAIFAVYYYVKRKNKSEGICLDRKNNAGGNYMCGSATACATAAPGWIGQYDQGNGRLGDDVLSGFNFYKAY